MTEKDTIKDEAFMERFYKLRKAKKLTQDDLGKMVGIHPTHIGKYERGLAKPNANNAKLLADALGTTVDYLMLGGVEEIAKERLKDREMLDLFRKVEGFSDENKKVVKKLLTSFAKMEEIENITNPKN